MQSEERKIFRGFVDGVGSNRIGPVEFGIEGDREEQAQDSSWEIEDKFTKPESSSIERQREPEPSAG